MPYSIVPAAAAHLSAIPRIEQAAAALFPPEDLPLALRYRVTDGGVLRKAQRDGHLWVALIGGRYPVGFARICLLDGEAHLDEMDVHPQHGRRGLGTSLVHTVIAWARERRFRRLTLVTFRHVPWNAPFYARLGFEPLPEEDIGGELRELLGHEAEAGLDPAKRIVMCNRLG